MPNQILMRTLNSVPMIERRSELNGIALSQVMRSDKLERTRRQDLLWIAKVEREEI